MKQVGTCDETRRFGERQVFLPNTEIYLTMWKGQHGKENNSGHNGKKCTYPHHAPHVPTLLHGSFLGCCFYPRVRISGCVRGHSKGVEDPLGSIKMRVQKGCPKTGGYRKKGGVTCAFGIKIVFYIPVYFMNDEVIFLHR